MIDADVISHHLSLFGLPVDSAAVLSTPGSSGVEAARAGAAAGRLVVASRPSPDFCRSFAVKVGRGPPPPALLRFRGSKAAWARLRTLHPYRSFAHPTGEAVVVDERDLAAWLWLPLGAGGLLLVGTDLAADLVRYRQGDPVRANTRVSEPLGGILGERPIYLFEHQLETERPRERYADHWAMALAQVVALKSGREPASILPGGAPGAIVTTGDDDQAYLETYEAQLGLLGQTPITYFMHPLTRHTRDSMRGLMRRPSTELGIHPDAVDAPERYAELLREQIKWYVKLVGERPISLRNHGFLNDGYWGHLDSWIREGIRISSNLPGVDGRVLNGSLLPARLVHHGALTEHWSILTALGDGVFFVHDMADEEAATLVHDYAADIRRSGLPGVLVVNLHPQNVERSRAMHRAVAEVAESDFHAWTLAGCLEWFSARDECVGAKQEPLGWRRALARLRGTR